MKKLRKRGFLDAKHQAKRRTILAHDSLVKKALVIAAAFFGAVIAAAIGGMFMLAGGQ